MRGLMASGVALDIHAVSHANTHNCAASNTTPIRCSAVCSNAAGTGAADCHRGPSEDSDYCQCPAYPPTTTDVNEMVRQGELTFLLVIFSGLVEM